MKAIPFIPAPSTSKSQSGPKTQTSRSEKNNAFAPFLSQAVTNSKNTKRPQNHSSNTTTYNHRNTGTGKTSRDSNQATSAQKANPRDRTDASAMEANNSVKSQTNKHDFSTQNTTETDPGKEKSPTNVKSNKSKSDNFILGLLGYLFNIQKNITPATIQKDAETLSNKFGIGKQESLNILQNIKSLDKNTSFGSHIIKSLAKDPQQDAKLQQIFEVLSSATKPDSQDDISSQLNALLQKNTTSQSKNALDTGLPISGDNKEPLPAHTSPIAQAKEKQSLIAQQLQRILSIDKGTKDIQIHVQPARQNHSNGLDALSAPLLNLENKQEQQPSAIPAAANNALPASLARTALSGEDTKPKHVSRLDEIQNHPFLVKVGEQDSKESTTVEAKDSGLQNAGDHKQTGPQVSPSTTDASGNQLQSGQFSFGSALTQSTQTGHHTLGTTASTPFTPWTYVHENEIINQVMQRFHINAHSPASKLVVKLYPEELGELKIDIQMKDGSIKANIVTQTQQVQQVLEKYIPKLRTFMEQQGLSVDDILVTNFSDNVGGHELFQDDFLDNNDFSPPGKSIRTTPHSDITFDKVFSDKSDVVSGVNVTV